MGEMFAYARVSTKDQNLSRQLDALAAFGVSKKAVFADRASGKDFHRPEYKRLLKNLRAGDVLVIKSIDRLGRNYAEILEEWQHITKDLKAAIVVLDMPLLDTREKKGSITNVLISDIVLQLLSYVAQVERENIKQRQAEGIAAAHARGVKFGRPKLKRPRKFKAVKQAYTNGSITRKCAARQLGVSVSTFSRWVNEDAKQ